MYCNSGIPPLQLNNALAGFQTKVCNSQGAISGFDNLTWQGLELIWKQAAIQLGPDIDTAFDYLANKNYSGLTTFLTTTLLTDLQTVVNQISANGNSSYLYRLFIQNSEGKILAYAGAIGGTTAADRTLVGGNTGNGLTSGLYSKPSAISGTTAYGFTKNATYNFVSNLSDQCRSEVFEAAQTNNKFTLIPAERLSSNGYLTAYMAGGIYQLTNSSSCQTPSAFVLRLGVATK